MARSARTCSRVPAMSSGNMCDWSSRLREKIVTWFPSLWICARRPAYLYCHDRPHLGDDGLGAGEPLGELRVDRLADLDVQGCHRALGLSLVGLLVDGPGDEAQIGGLVVGSLEQLALCDVVPPGLRQGIEHGRVADAQPQIAQQDAYHVFGGHAVNVCEQLSQSCTLVFDCSFARGLRD